MHPCIHASFVRIILPGCMATIIHTLCPTKAEGVPILTHPHFLVQTFCRLLVFLFTLLTALQLDNDGTARVERDDVTLALRQNLVGALAYAVEDG